MIVLCKSARLNASKTPKVRRHCRNAILNDTVIQRRGEFRVAREECRAFIFKTLVRRVNDFMILRSKRRVALTDKSFRLRQTTALANVAVVGLQNTVSFKMPSFSRKRVQSKLHVVENQKLDRGSIDTFNL